MIQGEPREETSGIDAKGAETLAMGPVMHAPEADRATKSEQESDYFSRTIESVVEDMDDDKKTVDDTLDSDVEELVNALAEAETERDDEWMEAALDDEPLDVVKDSAGFSTFSMDSNKGPAVGRLDPSDTDESDTEDEGNLLLPDSPTEKPDDSLSGKRQETDDLIDAVLATSSETPSEDATESESVIEEAIALVAETESVPEPTQTDSSPNLLGLQAINVLNEKITSSEGRYDDALTKIGHALGLIAERIDGLESRMTNQTIASVALAAAPPDLDDAIIDDSVAPYIARAERELKARKESGSMDIFDRIAKAAESEFDGQVSGKETKIIDNPGDGRRVGTKKWQPSKTVKRRMEQLEQARDGVATKEDVTAERSEPAARSLRADVDAITATEGAKATSRAQAKAAPEPVLDIEDEDDDSGLSVVPGARGRRRHRARKSRLDEDFENVFEENEDKPSIQSLRRKMRDRPVEEVEEVEAKGGMLGGILGKKTAKKVVSVEPEEESDDDLMAAFDAPEERAERAERKPAKGKKTEPDADMDFDDDGGGESGARFAGGPLLYVLIAGAAAAGFFIWKTYFA